MKWFLAATLFALAVALAIATAAIRADNARYRYAVESSYQDVNDRIVELRRLWVKRIGEATPERLAAAHWTLLRAETERRRRRLQ